MEILTLFKANIRRRKGSFVSVILLALIIAMSVTTILSIKESAVKGIEDANELCDVPDISIAYQSHRLTDEITEFLQNDERIERIKTDDIIITDKAHMKGKDYVNPMFVKKADENIRLLNEKHNGVTDGAPAPQRGEIYVPLGFLTDMSGKVGDTLTLELLSGEYDFTIKGVLLDPLLGCSMIGYKSFIIGGEDFDELSSAVAEAQTEERHALGKIVSLYKSDGCGLTNAKLRRELNLEHGVTDMAIVSGTREMYIHYTALLVEVITSILMVFIAFLLAIVVIVTVHSISAEIETNYVTFGVLKAQGFGKGKIRSLFMLQYLSAELIGAVIGIVFSVPLVGVTSNIFVGITAIPAVTSIPFGIVAAIIAALFALSAAAIFFVTKKVNKISPVRAISGAKNEIYFDSRLNAPISKKLLSPSLALRQLTTAKRRYVGTLAITAILMFFMVAVNSLANTLSSKSAMEAMGLIVSEVYAEPKKRLSDNELKDIENEIERFSEIRRAYYTAWLYFSFDGEEILATVYKDPSQLPYEAGRAPLYDNEIAVTPVIMEEFGVKIGDEVTIGYRGKKEQYLITGTTQLLNDTGRCFIISDEGAMRIDCNAQFNCNYHLESDDEALCGEIVTALNEKFGDIIEADIAEVLIDDAINAVVVAIRVIIHAFSILFSLIVVYMVCSKAFVRERTDIGIFKATGFRSSDLRRQFAFRFLFVSTIGAAVGGVLGYFLAGKTLGVMLRSVGITSFNAKPDISSFAIPAAVICLCFLIFSYLVSGKIKTVKIRELVTE